MAFVTNILRLIEDELGRLGGSRSDLSLITNEGSPYPRLFARALLRGINETGWQPFPAELHAIERIPAGWRIVDDVEPSDDALGWRRKEIESFARKDGLRGPQIREFAIVENANLGLVDASRFIDAANAREKDGKEDISCKAGICLVFTGTILCDPKGCMYYTVVRASQTTVDFRDGIEYLGYRWRLEFEPIESGRLHFNSEKEKQRERETGLTTSSPNRSRYYLPSRHTA